MSSSNVANKRELTLIILKPDAVQRGLIGKIIQRFEQKGLKLLALKLMMANEELLKEHYIEHANRHFFNPLLKFMSSGPVVPMVWEGLNAVKIAPKGKSDPSLSAPGTIRGDLSVDIERNLILGSDSVEAALREIDLWFKKEEMIKWSQNSNDIL
ncbi:nucleoside diphosphate kinase-like [Contarinia nasturtii]|uniref:nucleoside diphosphate kinase-like n=1 Tax=Contarinia nasturtii TaxID=265458 RepID=UPI0012D3B5E8|nr:nucleoside diphosphate kinase-like [Contarinia nasturtii]